ncbi:MAG: restriction endonuclease, partial [Spirochaetota bacterium]|nr:restriction endonuclease [Spirochaetota bacterium]
FAIAIHLNDPDKAKQALQNLIDIEPSSFRWNTLMDTLTEILSLHEKAMKEYNEKIKAKTKEDMRLSLDQLLNEKKSSEENEPANQEPMPELDLNTSFSGFIEYWSKKDILEDTVWQLSNLSRGESFDISKYLDSLERKQEGKSEANVEVIPELANHFKSLARKEFLDKNRKILNKLKFDVSKEEYGSEEVFLSQGDGADYIATLKGSDKKDRYIIQVRRWQSKNIGELVMKELSSQVADKRAKQGIFITTGELSKDALNYVEKSQNINVIQGKQLDLLLNGIIVPK